MVELNNQKGYLNVNSMTFTYYHISERIGQSTYIQIYVGQVEYIISSSPLSFWLLAFSTNIIQYTCL